MSVAYVVELEPGCWLADGQGDPPRCCKIENAKVFTDYVEAVVAMVEWRKYRAFKNIAARKIEIPDVAEPETCQWCGEEEMEDRMFQCGSKTWPEEWRSWECWENQLAAAQRETHRLELALQNCRTLAARRSRKGGDEKEWWEHILRFCKDAGIKGSILREASE